MRLLHLLSYLLRVLVVGQRWVAPTVILAIACGVALTSPPVDTVALGFVLGVLFATAIWLGYSCQSLETPEQAWVTATRLGSERLLRWTKVLVAWLTAVPVPLVAIKGADLSDRLPAGSATGWMAAAVFTALAGVGVGTLLDAFFHRRSGYAGLALVALVVADLRLPGAPPMALYLGRFPKGRPMPIDWPAALASTLLAIGCLVVWDVLVARRD